ncbi:MAG: TfoX/Sxy family protein [Rickettsiales bacterium]
MAKTAYCEYIEELLSPYGDIKIKAMFGGYGIYMNGVIVGMIADDELYFKVDKSNQQQYEDLDSEPFGYDKDGKIVKMSYWKIPLDILEDEEQLPKWLDQSYQISVKTKRK